MPITMQRHHFYFISDQYFIDFPDTGLMQNKERVSGVPHSRPSFYAIPDKDAGIYWMIPISSKVTKYKAIHHKKFAKHGKCDTILFFKVLGYEKAFLIQNMFPVSEKYITTEYTHQNNPVLLPKSIAKSIEKAANKVLALHKNGHKLIIPDVLSIKNELLKQMQPCASTT